MNIIVIIICFLGNHVSNALKNSDKVLVVSIQSEDSGQKFHQYTQNLSPNINQNLYDPELFLQNLLIKQIQMHMTKKKEVNLRSALLNYVFGFIFNEQIKWHVGESDQNYSKSSDEVENIIITNGKELETAESQDEKLKNDLVENEYYKKIWAKENEYKSDSINILSKIEIKNTIVYSKMNRDGETPFYSSTYFDSSCLYDEIRNFLENKFAGKTVLSEDEEEMNYPGKESQNPLIADNISFDSLSDKQIEDIENQDFDKVSSNRKIYKKIKSLENKAEYEYSKSSIIIKTATRSIEVQKPNNKNVFSFPPNFLMLILTNPYQYSFPSIILRTLLPRTLVKRSSPPTSNRQLEVPTVGHFPFSTAGSSLYGSYAYAQSKPSGFGMFPPLGGEGGEVGEPIEGSEGEEDEAKRSIKRREDRVE